jgi:hypothetical protein
MASSQPNPKHSELIKLTLFVHRKPSLSIEEFEQYWTYEHPKALASFNEKIGCPIRKYVQCHRNPDKIAQGNKVMGDAVFGGSNEFDQSYEAIVEVWFDRLVATDSQCQINL